MDLAFNQKEEKYDDDSLNISYNGIVTVMAGAVRFDDVEDRKCSSVNKFVNINQTNF